MPITRRPTLPYRAGYARGRGEAAIRTREMKFKVAFEETRQQNMMERLAQQFQDAQKRLQEAAQMQQQQEQDKAQAESLGIMAAMRDEELDSDNPYTSMAFAETRRQMGVPERAAVARRKTMAEEFDREMGLKGYEEIQDPSMVSVEFSQGGRMIEPPPKPKEDVVRVGGKTYRKPPADVSGLMQRASGKMRDYMLARGTPKTEEEFTRMAHDYEKQVWTKEQAKTRAEAMDDADEAFRTIYSDVGGKEGYQDEFDSIEGWLESMGFSEEEITSIAKIDYKGRNRTVIQWSKLRKMLFQKRLARMGVGTKAPERSKTEAFLESVERE